MPCDRPRLARSIGTNVKAQLRDKMRGTTIIAVRTKDEIALATDGISVVGAHPVESRANKISRIAPNVYAAQTGLVAPCEFMVGMLRQMIKEEKRSWRSVLSDWWANVRRLSESNEGVKGIAKSLLKDKNAFFLIIAPTGIYQFWGDGGFGKVGGSVCGDGFGGEYAEGAARALLKAGWTDARKIACEAVRIAGKCCVWANSNARVVVVKRKRQ